MSCDINILTVFALEPSIIVITWRWIMTLYCANSCYFISWYENVFFICSKSVSLIMTYLLYLISLWLALFAPNPLQVLLLACLHLIRILMFLLLGSVSVRDVIIFCLIYCIVNLGQPYSFRLRSCLYYFFFCTKM